MSSQHPIRYSILDLVPVAEGNSTAQALEVSLRLARLADGLGYHRYWVAEHHCIPGVASAATAVVIGQLAAATRRIRLGAGGIMLPNHAPLMVAEQFGTLEALFPGRIDLGLGRAPGGDQAALRALRRTPNSADSFPADVQELLGYLGDPLPGQKVLAIPGQGSNVPVYVLGSSLFGARLAAELGLPYAFASHFAPDHLLEAIGQYRRHFTPSIYLKKPYLIVAANVFAADTDAEAAYLFTTLEQLFVNLVRGTPRAMQPPVDQLECTALEESHMRRMTRISAVGGADSLRRQLEQILALTGADELIATAHIYDAQARLRSFEIADTVLAQLRRPD